jgi:amino acid transporter
MPKLKRVLGLPTLLFYGVGVIVGAGIYSVLGAVAGVAGHGVWLSLLLAAVPALLAALCYAELTTLFPKAGAAYAYIREGFPRWPGVSFVAGFLVAVTSGATAATVAIAFAGYLGRFVGEGFPGWAAALGVLAVCTGVNIAGIKESTWFTILCTTIEVVGLLLIFGAGVGGWGQEPFGRGIMEVPSMGGVLAGAALGFFVYTGFEGLANLAEESRKPERDLPIAILVSLAVTTTLYVLVAIAAVALVDPATLAGSSSPLSTAAEAAGPKLAAAMGWIALFSTANTALITVVVASRMLYGMAGEGQMPAALARTLPKRRSPWVAAIVIGLVAAAMLPLGGVALVAGVSSLCTLIVFAGVAAALIMLRRDRPELRARFRLPFAVARVPIVPVLAIIAIVALMTQFEPAAYLVVAGCIAAGVAMYAARGWWMPTGGEKKEPDTNGAPA